MCNRIEVQTDHIWNMNWKDLKGKDWQLLYNALVCGNSMHVFLLYLTEKNKLRKQWKALCGTTGSGGVKASGTCPTAFLQRWKNSYRLDAFSHCYTMQ